MNTFFRILTYLRAYRFRLAGAFICSVGVAGLSAVYAMLVQPVLDEIFIARNRELLLLLPLAVLAVALLKGAFAYGQAYLMSYIGHWLVADVRQQLFLHIIRLPIRFHDANSSGRLVARVISDVNEMANAIPSVLKDLFQQGLTFVALLGVAFYHNWKLASVVVFVLPFSGFVLMRVGKRIRKLSNRGQEHIGRMASVLKEAFSGIKIVKAYGQEDSELERFSLTNSAFRLAKVKSSQTSAMASPLLEVIGVCGVSVIIWFGGGQVIEGAMKPGEFFSFLSAMFMAYAPVRKMSGANESVQRALAGAQRVFSVLDLDSEMAKDEGKDTLKPITRTLEFENVTFVYEDAGEPALNHVNLSIHAGEVVAFVGASGSGKTTLVSLVPRFYRPTEGTLKIDG
ncbi:MAG: ABC transporter ATP-binding protein, partial [Nitrospira sp.]|nr:ABC transporter ATP-binding protein [Nitrospira sp.]MCA9474283.1 ABC transporter ATP-binding protein [Nitrospira sp.]